MIDSKEIGNRIRQNRLDLKLSQAELANLVGVSPSTIAMYEAGERIPRDEIKSNLAKAFKKSVQSIFFEF